MHLTYNPARFEIKNYAEAQNIILTPQADMSPQQRWETEGPYLLTLMEPLSLNEDSFVLDFGCGIGRMSKLLIDTFGCRVVGVDIAESMREMAKKYVNSDKFRICSPDEFSKWVETGQEPFDVVLSIWVLQHCLRPAQDIKQLQNVLKPNGKLFILNGYARHIPCKETHWANDGFDIRKELGKTFSLDKIHDLDVGVLGQEVVNNVFCGIYRKAPPTIITETPQPDLLADNACQGCNVCCKLPYVSELNKPSKTMCWNCEVGKGCKIYNTRPIACRNFKCLWLQTQDQMVPMEPELRPDRCGVMFTKAKGFELLEIHVDTGISDVAQRFIDDQKIKGLGGKVVEFYRGEK